MDYRAKDGEMRRVHRETVDVLARFGRDGAFQRLPRHEGGIVVAGGSRRSAAPRPRALGRFVDTGWQDSRAVHDSRGPCSEKGPSLARSARMHSRKAICGAFRIHGAHILPTPARFGCMAAICCQGGALFPPEATFGMHGAQNLPRIAAWERTRAKYCHRRAPGNAPWRHGAGKHRANETSANSTTCDDASKKP